MANINKEFDRFERFLKMNTKDRKVRDITRNFLIKPEGENYNEYTIEHFLMAYKLSRMEEFGIINEKIASDLKEMLDMKSHIRTVILEEKKTELYDPSYKSDIIPKLHRITETINNQLKRYNLTIDDLSIKDMIDNSIKEENKQPINESSARVKK